MAAEQTMTAIVFRHRWGDLDAVVDITGRRIADMRG